MKIVLFSNINFFSNQLALESQAKANFPFLPPSFLKKSQGRYFPLFFKEGLGEITPPLF